MAPLQRNRTTSATSTTTQNTERPPQTTYTQNQDAEMADTTQGSASAAAKPEKICFVTIGATASFDALLEAVLSGACLGTLINNDYTELLLQYGEDGEKFLDCFKRDEKTGDINFHGLKIRGFKYNKAGLVAEMLTTKGEDGRQEGVVIAHAGKRRIT